LTAKNITYLVNLSERDFIRRKNKYLPKIKQWIDENSPGDQLLPMSVALEERLAGLSDEEQKAELEKVGAQSGALGKIITAGTFLAPARHFSRIVWLVLMDLCLRAPSNRIPVALSDQLLYLFVFAYLSSLGRFERVTERLIWVTATLLAGGEDEVRSWTIREGITAPEAAGVIHNDFRQKFVCGEM
jgi:ribosome-binding ATPase YchF (GTP1/OBG family)